MKKRVIELLVTLLSFLLLSCRTSPATETGGAGGGEAVSVTAGETAADTGGAAATASDAVTGAADGTAAGKSVAEIASATEKTVEPQRDESRSLPLPEAVVTPAAPRTGEEVAIVVDATPYETVTFDFGEGGAKKATYTYVTFGVKTVLVTGSSGNQAASTEISFPVTGTATLSLKVNSVEHDTSWEPLIDARLEAAGQFDAIVVYENKREVLKIPPPDTYKIPVPFTGERTFTAELFHKGLKVADVDAVTITGLNSPPGKPVYEGGEFVSGRPGEEIRFTVVSEDPNKDPVVYKVKFAPEGARFDELTGVFSFTPTRAQRGVYLLHFTAYDQPYGLASQFVQRGIMVQ